MAIEITAKGLGKFMAAESEASKRKILKDFKNPSDVALAKTKYYQLAISKIKSFHSNNYTRAWLLDQANTLDASADRETPKSRATRLRANAKALRQYQVSYSQKLFEVLPSVRMRLSINGVVIKVNPELHVLEGKKEKIIVLGFSQSVPQDRLVKVVCQVLYEACALYAPNVKSSGIQYYDVLRGDSHKGARASSRMVRDLHSACELIEAWWDRL
jgi:hypothetical protein